MNNQQYIIKEEKKDYKYFLNSITLKKRTHKVMLRKILKPTFSPVSKSINRQLKYKYFNHQPNNFDASKDYYRILDLNKDASENDIKKSYYKLAKQYHPDVNKGYEGRFKEISQAYEILSNEQTKKQYDSARVFKEGWSRMGSKASQGTYSYEEYQNVFYSMSSEERQQFQRQAQARLRRFGMILGGFVLFWIFFSRTPHKAYTEFNGTLIPIEPTGPYQYPDPYMSQAQVYNPYGGQHQSPYGQPNNPYVNQPYQPQQQVPQHGYGGSPAGQYGSQYPQAQYLSNYNQYQNQPQQQQGYYPQHQQQYNAPQQHKSQFTIDRPQPHQPYPNSGYAEKPMQSNYQPGFKAQAPGGLQE